MAARRDNTPKIYPETACLDCGALFQKTGPNHKRCDPCRREKWLRYIREWHRSRATRLSACPRCGLAFPSDVHAHVKHCAPCAAAVRQEQSTARYAADPNKHREYGTRHYHRHKEAILAKRQTPEEKREIARRQRERRHRDPGYRLHCNISSVVNMGLKGNKAGRRWELLVGYTLADLKRHLERQFTKGMTWANYGKGGWVVDHVIPRASFCFEYPDDPDFRACWALTNLRPLWAAANMSKAAARTLLL